MKNAIRWLCLFVVLTLISCSQPTENIGDDNMGFSIKPSGTEQTLRGVSSFGTTAIAVGEAGTILVSTDNGNTWAAKSSGINQNLFGITLSDNTAIAVGKYGFGKYGTILVSNDSGNTWVSKESGGLNSSTLSLESVSLFGNYAISVGNQVQILVSTDNGNTWTATSMGSTPTFLAVSYTGTTTIIVGYKGTILVSTDYVALDITTPVAGHLRYFFDREHQVAEWPSNLGYGLCYHWTENHTVFLVPPQDPPAGRLHSCIPASSPMSSMLISYCRIKGYPVEYGSGGSVVAVAVDYT